MFPFIAPAQPLPSPAAAQPLPPHLLLLYESGESFVKDSVETTSQEVENTYLSVSSHCDKHLAIRGEGQTEGCGLCLHNKGRLRGVVFAYNKVRLRGVIRSG